jgi:hypothetical protein
VGGGGLAHVTGEGVVVVVGKGRRGGGGLTGTQTCGVEEGGGWLVAYVDAAPGYFSAPLPACRCTAAPLAGEILISGEKRFEKGELPPGFRNFSNAAVEISRCRGTLNLCEEITLKRNADFGSLQIELMVTNI